MSPSEKQDFLMKLVVKHSDERRLGSVDIVKVILSIVSVLLTVLATIEVLPRQEMSLCSLPLQFLARICTYPLLLSCCAVCVYHLYYTLNQYNTKMALLVSTALDNCDSFESAYDYLKKNNTIDHPWLYKKSLLIIFALFGLSLLVILLRVP
jgi:hypothetical protein